MTRGPWLVDASSASASVCWRSAGEDECRAFAQRPSGAPFSYSIAASTRSWLAKTLPSPSQPLRLAVFGDSGKATQGQFKVAKVLERYDPDLALVVGDVVYPRGEDKDYDAKFFRPYAASLSRIAFFPCPGNHDYGNYRKAGKGQAAFEQGYAKVFRRPKYYSFDAGPAHIVSLDTNQAYSIPDAAPIGPDSEQRRWLEEDLARSTARWKLVFMHVPLYQAKAAHGDSASLRKSLEPVFQAGKVDVVFQGHEHTYQRSRTIGGVVYVTAGAGGGGLNWFGASGEWLDKEVMDYGLVTTRLDRKSLVLEFLDQDGAVKDRARIDKP